MSWNLYGYDAPMLDENDRIIAPPPKGQVEREKPIGYTVADKPLSKGTIDGKLIESPTLTRPEIVLPKVKEFDKKKILEQFKTTDTKVSSLRDTLNESLDLMAQEDADDIYEFARSKTKILDLIKEWNKLTECLTKELELSLPISKPTV